MTDERVPMVTIIVRVYDIDENNMLDLGVETDREIPLPALKRVLQVTANSIPEEES